MTTTHDIVQRLWGLATMLWHDGVSFMEYVTELTYLLFLKMAEETDTEGQIPEGYRWRDLISRDGVEQLTFYRQQLVFLGANGSDRVQDIFANAQSAIRQPANLAKLVSEIDAIDWYSARAEGLGDLYEGLLERVASEKKSGAGQYFTPRPLIEVMVELIAPEPGEIVSDPAAGTLGFLICVNEHINAKTDDLFDLSETDQEFQRRKALYAVELVPDTRRLALMNAMLHGIEGEVVLGDTLSPLGQSLPKSDVILSNPPFGAKKGSGIQSRDDFTFPTNNKQLAFLQHIYRNLKPGGRAAVVLPDNVLFEDNIGQQIRRDLMEKCNLHTILRLPTGIFYAQGVKTNVLFFQRGKAKDTGNTKEVWIYDLRSNMPSFGKRTPFTASTLRPFVDAYGRDANGGATRTDEGEDGRFRCFKREEIAKRGDNLDVAWLRDESADLSEEMPEPDQIAAEILSCLGTATEEIQALLELLETDDVPNHATAK